LANALGVNGAVRKEARVDVVDHIEVARLAIGPGGIRQRNQVILNGLDSRLRGIRTFSEVALEEKVDGGKGVGGGQGIGIGNMPAPSDQKMPSPVPSMKWLAPVPPMKDWWKLSLMEYSSASCFKTGTSPFCML